MSLGQWDIWKCRPAGFEKDHWFVIVSNQERLNSPSHQQINGLACFTLRGEPLRSDVRLDQADGFPGATVCQCDFIYFLNKSALHSSLGSVTWERQQLIKAKLKEVFRL
jgi:hypothetical protein